MATADRPSRLGPPRLRVAVAVSLGAFLLSARLNTVHNDFPLRYHPDEPAKVQLVLSDTNSFYHPLLLLSATRLGVAATGAEDPQAIVEVGRVVSALCGAGAVAAWTALAYLEAGLLAAACVGLLTALSPALFLYAHYMKEDTALLFGVAAALLALSLARARRRAWSTALLGLACGVATSGKYIGFLVVVIALPVLLWPPPATDTDTRRRRLGWFLAGFVAILLVVNAPALANWDTFRHGIGFELQHVARGHSGLVAARRATRYAAIFVRETPLAVVVLAAAASALLAVRWRRRPWVEKIVFAFAVVYAFCVVQSPIVSTRYLLPVVLSAHVLAGLLLAAGLRRIPGALGARVLSGVIVVGVVLAPQGRRCWQYARELQSDTRAALERWVAGHVPPDAVIAQDFYAGLPEARPDGWPQVQTHFFAADLGSLQRAQALGVTHIAVCELAYARFFDPALTPRPEERRDTERRRHFYRDLFARGALLWEGLPATPTHAFTSPTVRLYRLPARESRVGAAAPPPS